MFYEFWLKSLVPLLICFQHIEMQVRIPSKVARYQLYWLYEAEINVNDGYNYEWTWPDYTRRHVISNQGIDYGLRRITDIYSWITMIVCDFLTSGTLALTGSICRNLQFYTISFIFFHAMFTVFPGTFIEFHILLLELLHGSARFQQPFFTCSKQLYHCLCLSAHLSVHLSGCHSFFTIFLSPKLHETHHHQTFILWNACDMYVFKSKSQRSGPHRPIKSYVVSTSWLHAYLTDSLYIWHKCNSWSTVVSHIQSSSKSPKCRPYRSF